MFRGDECMEVSKHFCHLVRQSSVYAIFCVLHLQTSMGSFAPQDRVPRLLLNEPEIGSHQLWCRTVIFNSDCFSDPSHCPYGAHHSVLNRSSLMLPCTVYTPLISSIHFIGRLGSQRYQGIYDQTTFFFSSLVAEFNPMINSKERVGRIGKEEQQEVLLVKSHGQKQVALMKTCKHSADAKLR